MRHNIAKMNFRTLPSTIPLHSPSPDNKSPNCLTPTISPNNIEIKKNVTPSKTGHYSSHTVKENMPQKLPTHHRSYQYEHNSYSQEVKLAPERFDELLKEKDQVIKNLKKIIDMITDKQPRINEISGDHVGKMKSLENQVKVLTLQNQKLVSIIQKLEAEQKTAKKQGNNRDGASIDENWQEEVTIKFQNYEKQIEELNQTLKNKQARYQSQLQNINKSNLTLATHLKNIQDQKKQLQNQNMKLLKILKQKNQVNSRIVKNSHNNASKLQASDVSEQESQARSHKSHQRLSLLKIKDQYAQNLRVQRQEIAKQIQDFFEIMKMGLQSTNIKVTGMANRLSSIQKITWNQIKKDDFHSSQKLIEQKSLQEKLSQQKIPEKAKSEIYIEQGPQSSSCSRHKISRDEFSRIIDTQRRSKMDLEDQVQQLKQELFQLRFKYEKLCMDTSSVSYSKRIMESLPDKQKSQSQQELQIKYESSQQELKKKQKQIDMLYNQIKLIQVQKLSKEHLNKQYIKQLEAQTEKIRQYQFQIEQLKIQTMQEQKRSDENLRSSHTQMQNKLKLLMENYQAEIDLLRKQKAAKINIIEQYKLALNQKNQQEKLYKNKEEQNLKILKQLQNRDQEKQNALDKQISKNNQLQQQLKNVKGQIAELNTEIKVMKFENNEIKKMKDETQQENIMQMLEINEKKGQVQLKAYIISNLQAKLQQLTKQTQNIRQQNEQTSKKNNNVTQQLKNKQQQYSKLHENYLLIRQSISKIELNNLKNLLIDYTEIQNQVQAQNQAKQPQTPILKLPKQSQQSLWSQQSNQNKIIKLETLISKQQIKILELQAKCEENFKLQELYKNRYQECLEKLQQQRSDYQKEIQRIQAKYLKEEKLEQLRRKYIKDQIQRLEGIMAMTMFITKEKIISVPQKQKIQAKQEIQAKSETQQFILPSQISEQHKQQKLEGLELIKIESKSQQNSETLGIQSKINDGQIIGPKNQKKVIQLQEPKQISQQKDKQQICEEEKAQKNKIE